MRLSVLGSLFAHAALLLVALRLPAVRHAHTPTTIDVEITRPPAPAPPPPTLPTPPPLPVATPRPPQRRDTPAPPSTRREEPPPPAPPSTAAPDTSPGPPKLGMRPTGPVDLQLRDPGAIFLGRGAPSGSPEGSVGGAPSAKKPWRPRGSAGDPLLGRLDETKEDPFPLEPTGDGYRYDGPSFAAKIAADGQVTFEHKPLRDFKWLSGGFDINDMVMRGQKQDPYRYEKEKFMAHTAKLRDELRRQAARDRLALLLPTLPKRLEALWSDGSRSAAERREGLYTLWQEVAALDDAKGQAEGARAIIEAFIRLRLPEGSPDAYSEEELRRYNTRKRLVRFDPYRRP